MKWHKHRYFLLRAWEAADGDIIYVFRCHGWGCFDKLVSRSKLWPEFRNRYAYYSEGFE